MNLTKTNILSGGTFFYNELFPHAKLNTVNNKYIINDAYCMNPSCDCKEVILEFCEKDTLNFKFAIRLSLKKAEYMVIDHISINEQQIAELINQLFKNNNTLIKQLQNRYVEMKNEGNKIINGTNNVNAPLVDKVKRNDPCPCGSGKKYKKCCGI